MLLGSLQVFIPVPQPNLIPMGIRILHVIDSMQPASGGAPAIIRQLIPYMKEMGLSSEVVCFDDHQSVQLGDTFPMHCLGKGRGPWHYHRRFRSWLQRELPRFDVCIAHGLWLYTGYALSQEVRSLRKRLPTLDIRSYVMPHGMLDPWFQRSAHRRVKALRNLLWWVLVEKSIIQSADGLLFTSEVERLLASGTFHGYDPSREMVLGLGSDHPPVRTNTMQEAWAACCPGLDERPYVLFLGRIDPKKGLDMLIDAWRDLYASRQDSDAWPVLVLAGPGWGSPYGQSLQHKISSDPFLASEILPVDLLLGPAKWGALYQCEAFVLPSHQENFGVTVAEALSCGRPVLLTRGVNIHAFVTSSASGFSCEPTRQGLSQMLSTWVSMEGEQRAGMSQAARKLWEDEFSIRAVAHRWVQQLSQP